MAHMTTVNGGASFHGTQPTAFIDGPASRRSVINPNQITSLNEGELLKLRKTLEKMYAAGYDPSHPRYQALLTIYKRCAANAAAQRGSHGPANGAPRSAVTADKPTNGVPTSAGPSAPLSTGPFTREQLAQLKAQILAYKYLSRNLPLPQELIQGIKGTKSQAFSEPPAPVQPSGAAETPAITHEEPVRLQRMQHAASPSLRTADIRNATPQEKVRAPRAVPTPKAPPKPAQPQALQPAKLSPMYLAQERERRITARICRRLEELQTLPEDLPQDLKTQALIEEKQLRLLSLQRKLRREIAIQIRNETALQVAHDTTAYRRGSRKNLKQQLNQSEILKEREEQKRQQRQREFVQAVVAHAKNFKEFHTGATQKWRKITRSMMSWHTNQQKREQQRRERAEKERLNALRDNDEEAYLRLLEETKNERLTTLLRETDEYLSKIGALVAKHQEDEEEDEKRDREAEAEYDSGDEPGTGAGSSAGAEDTEQRDEDVTQLVRAKNASAAIAREKKTYYTMVHKVEEEVREQPSILVGGTLKKYQMVGLQWLVSLYNNRLNGILADEMGLGKTIQTIALICYLIEMKQNKGPYLVIVPLSTLSNWAHEFEHWAPSVITVHYKGMPPVRKSIYQNHIANGKFNVVLTTYEYVMKDKANLSKIKWNYIIIDEGHRMKNHSCKLATSLSKHYSSRHRLLLTGTPLQNSLPELWALLNFLLPSIFNSVTNFEEWFNAPFANTGDKLEMTEEESLLIINRLHKVLRPFLLRRLKKQVEDQLPDKVEKILKCRLSAWQQRMYAQMRDYGVIRIDSTTLSKPKGANKQGVRGLANTLMQLRKICNHPYLFNEMQDWALDDNLIRSAGKFDLLDRVLPKFKATGHRVLIFSQMTSLMSVMEDYFQYRGYQYLRLDGSTKAEDRAELLKKFNAPDSPYFIFMLSTRAGGLGLNLQTADTVILFDSDWNPHIDLQAQDRAHRIGQKNEVRVFRLISENSVEENILSRAQWKMGLDEKVIEAGMFNKRSNASERKSMLESILKKDKQNKHKPSNIPTDQEINRMIARKDGEFELYEKMDAERHKAEEREWRRKGNKGKYPRLVTDEELPAWMKEERPIVDEVQELRLNYGRGRRQRGDVNYDDGLTELQWTKIIEEGGDVSDLNALREKNKLRRKRRAQTKAKKDGDDDAEEENGAEDEEEEDEAEMQSPPSKRRRRASSKSVTSTAKTLAPPVAVQNIVQQTPRKRGRPPRADNKQPKISEQQRILNAKYSAIWEKIKKEKEPGTDRFRSQLFVRLPSKRAYPDYYVIIRNPIDMSKINARIKKSEYTDPQQFRQDFNLMFNNAQEYNMPGSQVFEDAVALQHLFNAEFDAELANEARGDTAPQGQHEEEEAEAFHSGQRQQQAQRSKRRIPEEVEEEGEEHEEHEQDGYDEENSRDRKRKRSSTTITINTRKTRSSSDEEEEQEEEVEEEEEEELNSDEESVVEEIIEELEEEEGEEDEEEEEEEEEEEVEVDEEEEDVSDSEED